jgi:negative modulator of initiation of replication
MRTLQVEDDVYFFLLRSTSRFGETESETLRRLLRISRRNPAHEPEPSSNGSVAPERQDPRSKELLTYIRGGGFRVASDATKRYLAILGKVHEQNAANFVRIRESVSGRNRIYFSEDRQDIAGSGSSTMPQRIPGSTYWALTNENVNRKRRMLKQVLEFFEYDPAVIAEATSTLQGR